MVVVYKNMVGLSELARWVTLQHYFGTTLLKRLPTPVLHTKQAMHVWRHIVVHSRSYWNAQRRPSTSTVVCYCYNFRDNNAFS